MKQKIYIGITKEKELYYLEVETRTQEHDYFAMSGTTLSLLPEAKQAEEEAWERLEDDTEVWKQQVVADQTELGFKDWTKMVMSIDGWKSMYEIDYDIGAVEHEGGTYYFDNASGGQHEEHEFKHLFITEKSRELLMQIWKKYHLKKEDVDLKRYLLERELKQNEEEIAKEAVDIILKAK